MAEVTAMRNNCLPYPIYGVAWTVVAPLLDADGDPISPSSPDSEVSKNGDTFADCTNEATEIATSSGVVYLTLTSTEMTADVVAVRIQSTGAKTTIITLYPRKLTILSTGTCQGSNDTGDIQLASGDSAVDDFYNGCIIVAAIDGTTEARHINDYVGSTKVAEVSPAWNTAQPDSNDTYTIYLPEGRQFAQADTRAFGGTAGTFSSGRPEVNTTHAAGTAWGSGAITAASIASDAITAAKIADGAIDAGAIASDAITAAKIADGAIDAATFAAGAITASAIASDAITDAKVASDVTIASVTGAVGSVTGNVGGNVTGSVGSVATGGISASSFAAGAIDAAAIAANAIGASELATDAVSEIAAGVWDLATSGHTTSGTFGEAMNAAGSAGDPWTTSLPGSYTSGQAGYIVGTNLNATVSSRASQTSLDTLDDYVDTEVATIVTQTSAASIRTAVGLANANLDTQLDALPTNAELATALGTADDAVLSAIAALSIPTAAQIRSEIDSNSTQLAAIVADTNELQTDWANGGRLDLLLDTVITDTTQIKGDLPQRITKNTALSAFPFFMVSSSDHVTGATGLTVTATRSLDGGSFGSCTNSVSEIGNGWYKIDLAAGDLNGNTVALKFTATGADARMITVITEPT